MDGEAMTASRLAFGPRLGAAAGSHLLTTWLGTTRSELIEGHQVERDFLKRLSPTVFVLWHGRLLLCAHRYRGYGVGTLISQNRDGEYITGMIERWGYRVVRGSSSRRGSSAFRGIVRLLESGAPVALTPDGPRGPRQKMKLGPLRAAMMAGVPVIPAAASATRGAFFGRWDRFLVPAPFARCPYAFGDPIHIDPSTTEDELRGVADLVEQRLNALTDRVDEAARAGRR